MTQEKGDEGLDSVPMVKVLNAGWIPDTRGRVVRMA